jgi:hypothetical protein
MAFLLANKLADNMLLGSVQVGEGRRQTWAGAAQGPNLS